MWRGGAKQNPVSCVVKFARSLPSCSGIGLLRGIAIAPAHRHGARARADNAFLHGLQLLEVGWAADTLEHRAYALAR